MPTLLETQFPIAQLSLESYLERSVTHGKILNSLGKWWGAKPFVLTRSIILASLFEASDDPDRWPEDLEIFLRLMCLDNAGMWKRRNPNLDAISSKPSYPSFASLCYAKAGSDNLDLFKDEDSWAPRMSKDDKARREALEKRVFYSLGHTIQRRYTMRVEEIDGPPEESWSEINAYCGTHASSLAEWVNEMSQRRLATRSRWVTPFRAWDPFHSRRPNWGVMFMRPILTLWPVYSLGELSTLLQGTPHSTPR